MDRLQDFLKTSRAQARITSRLALGRACALIALWVSSSFAADEKVFPGTDEQTPSRAHYFSWINNAWEGSTEAQTLINIDFFRWLRDEYGMQLDYYALDAGNIDSQGRYGSMDGEQFKERFPRGFGRVAAKAKTMGTRLGMWETTRHPGQTLTFRQEWVNRNASWCVYPYRLGLYLMDSQKNVAWSGVDRKFDPRPWLCGRVYPVNSEFPLPSKLKPGTYELRIALVDESGTPCVRLAIAAADEAKRYRLGSVRLASN